MATKKNKSKNPILKEKKEAEALAKSREESNIVKEKITKLFFSAETIAVDTEFREVSFYVDNIEFNNVKKNISESGISLDIIKTDKDSLTLYYKYSLNV